MNKRMWSLTRASFLELIRDPMVTGLAMLFPLAFIGMYLILPDLRITPQLTISALAFGLPSIILLGALALGLTGTAAPMVQHRRDGALRNIGMTPITPAMYLGAQVPARVLVIVAETLLILAIAALTGTLRISDPGLFLVAIALCIGTTLSLGIFLGSVSGNPTLVGAMGGMLIPGILFLCGVFMPFRMMPEWVETVAKLLPFTYVGDMLRHTISGVPLSYSLGLGVTICIIWSAAMALLAVKLFRWSER
jgi:ABC-type multidrug transport system permease subunit